MRRRGSSFSFVLLLLVVAVVLYLATRSLRSTIPAAEALVKPSPKAQEAPEQAAPQQTGDSVRPSRLPNLRDVKQTTDAHANEVRDAVEQTRE
jgi:hypothetical protein